jgi:hypothetical protein
MFRGLYRSFQFGPHLSSDLSAFLSVSPFASSPVAFLTAAIEVKWRHLITEAALRTG